MRIGPVREQAQIHTALELLRPLGLQVVLGLRSTGRQSAEAALGRGEGGAPATVAEGVRRVSGDRLVRPGLLPGLAVGQPGFAEAHEPEWPLQAFENAIRVVQVLGEFPGDARLREPRPAVGLPKRGRSVAPHTSGDVQLRRDVRRRLAEEANGMDSGFGRRGRIAIDRVFELERLRRDQAIPDHEQLLGVAHAEVVPEGQGAGEAWADTIRCRRRQVVVDLVVRERCVGHLPGRKGRARLRQADQSLVAAVIRAQGIVDAQPGPRQIVRVHVPERPAHVLRVGLLIQHEERVVIAPTQCGRGRRGPGVPVGPVQARGGIEKRLAVEVGRRARPAEQQPADVRPLLHEVRAHVAIGDVALDREVVEQAVRRFQPDARAVVPIVRPDDRAVVVQVRAGQIELRAVVPAGDRQVVVEAVARVKQLTPVIVDRGAAELRAPAERHGAASGRAARRRHAERPLAEARLKRDAAVHIVDRGRAPQRIARRSGLAGLRRD